MRRAIQTAKYCFPSQLERDGPLLLVPLAQENTDLPCDTGSNPAALMQEFGNLVDASMVEEGWNSKTGIYASAPAALEERARQFRAWLKQRPEQDVAVVGHGVFWHYVTGSVDASGNQTGAYWKNVDWRFYNFSDSSNSEADLVEYKASIMRREVLGVE